MCFLKIKPAVSKFRLHLKRHQSAIRESETHFTSVIQIRYLHFHKFSIIRKILGFGADPVPPQRLKMMRLNPTTSNRKNSTPAAKYQKH